eukprot:GHVH01000612.1.p1 GENE.GHVH01000612.1~~GHVH01000612.1.p1  ORF type:complete len:566 (+),score=69.34 GHVH01000612.1:72-1700(+)
MVALCQEKNRTDKDSSTKRPITASENRPSQEEGEASKERGLTDASHGGLSKECIFFNNYQNGVKLIFTTSRFYGWAWAHKLSIPTTTVHSRDLSSETHSVTDLEANCSTDLRKLRLLNLHPDAINLCFVPTDEFPTLCRTQKVEAYSYCMSYVSQVTAIRGINYLGQLCTNVLKNSHKNENWEHLSLYAAEISFLLSNLTRYVDGSSTDLISTAKDIASKVLEEWYKVYVTSRAQKYIGVVGNKDHVYDSTNEFLAVLEALHANRTLNVFSEETAYKLHQSLLLSPTLEELKKDLQDDVRKVKSGLRVTACPHCNCKLKLSAGGARDNCSSCSFKLPPIHHRYTPYSLMTDATIWLFLLKEFDIEWLENGKELAVVNVVHSFIHKARPYQSEVQLGRVDFKLQLYFVTHLCLVLSKFGAFRLPVLSLWPEFSFLLHSLPLVVILHGDNELAGEMLHVIKLFKVPQHGSKAHNELQPMIDLLFGSEDLIQVISNVESFVSSFIMSTEMKKGEWCPPVESGRGLFYDLFHSTYCSILGLALKRI